MSDIAVGLDFQTSKAEASMRNVAREATAMAKSVENAVNSSQSKWEAFVSRASGAAKSTEATLQKTSQQIGNSLPMAIANGTAALGLFGIGFGTVVTAATGLYDYLFNNSPKAEGIFKEQARLVSAIKDAYKDAGDAAGKFYDQSKAILTLQNNLAISKVQDAIRGQIDAALKQGVGYTPQFDPSGAAYGQPILAATDALGPFRQAWEELDRTLASGGESIEKFRNTVADIGNRDAAFKGIAGRLLEITQEGGEANDKLKELFRTKRLLEGNATPADREGLGLSNRVARGPADPFESAVISSTKRIAAMRAEAAAVGQSAGAHAQLRMEAQLLEAAQQKGASATEGQMKRIMELGKAANDAALTLARMRMEDQIKFERQTLGMSSGEQGIASSMRQLYGEEWQSNMDGAIASQMRLNNSLREYGEIGRASLTSIGQAMRDGKITTQEWSGILDNLSSRLMDLAMNSAWDALIGGGRGGGGGLMSMLGGLLGGGGGSSMVSGLGAGTGGHAFPMFNAHGNAFHGGNIIPFAKGGAFTNSVVDRTTIAPLAAFGEAGPEAIIPLKRGSDGKLGVSSQGERKSGANVSVTIPINIDATGADSAGLARVETQLARLKNELPARIIMTVKDAQERGVRI